MVKVNDSISVRKIENEIFIFDRKSSRIHSLNRVASFIWELLVDNIDPGKVTERVNNQFEIDKETAEKDTTEFITELKEKKLLQFIA